MEVAREMAATRDMKRCRHVLRSHLLDLGVQRLAHREHVRIYPDEDFIINDLVILQVYELCATYAQPQTARLSNVMILKSSRSSERIRLRRNSLS
jgi:hypothetical protein